MKSYYSHSTIAQSETTLHNVLDIISDGVWDWDGDTNKVTRSSGWYKMLDYELDSFISDTSTWKNLIHENDYKEVVEHFDDFISGKINSYEIKYRCKKKDGSYIWVLDRAKILSFGENGRARRILGSHKNIHNEEIYNKKLKIQNELLLNNNLNLEDLIQERTKELELLNKQLKNKIKEIEYTASYDIVTEIYNRRKLEELFDIEISRAKRYSHDLSVVLIDIDKFKKFNDLYGHKVGDKVLFSLSSLIKTNIRSVDVFARWGGEEFIILFPNTSKEDAINKAEILRKKIEENLIIEDRIITCSFGVSSYIEGDDENSIFLRIDKALYLAKHDNRNNVKSI